MISKSFAIFIRPFLILPFIVNGFGFVSDGFSEVSSETFVGCELSFIETLVISSTASALKSSSLDSFLVLSK